MADGTLVKEMSDSRRYGPVEDGEGTRGIESFQLGPDQN